MGFSTNAVSAPKAPVVDGSAILLYRDRYNETVDRENKMQNTFFSP